MPGPAVVTALEQQPALETPTVRLFPAPLPLLGMSPCCCRNPLATSAGSFLFAATSLIKGTMLSVVSLPLMSLSSFEISSFSLSVRMTGVISSAFWRCLSSSRATQPLSEITGSVENSSATWIAPDLSAVASLLQVDQPTVRAVLRSWGPGKFDAELFLDGSAAPIATSISGVPYFEEAWEERSTGHLGHHAVNYLGRKHLVINKSSTDEPGIWTSRNCRRRTANPPPLSSVFPIQGKIESAEFPP